MNKEALKLPDAVLLRYHQAREIERIAKVAADGDLLTVEIKLADGATRLDRWRDLGGGLGYIPEPAE